MRYVPPFQLPVRGFTLIELLIVIAIIGILSAMSLVTIRTTREKARDAQRVTDVSLIGNALSLFYDTYGTYPQAYCDWVNPNSCSYSYTGYDLWSLGSGSQWYIRDYSYRTPTDGTPGTNDFLKPLVDKGFLSKQVVDPLNRNITTNTAYRYMYLIDMKGCQCDNFATCNTEPQPHAGWAYLWIERLENPKAQDHGDRAACPSLLCGGPTKPCNVGYIMSFRPL